MITFERLEKAYGKKLVLQEISGHIAERKITSLIGPNGAGKSTLLSIISRLIKYDGGSVFFMEKPLQDYKPNDLARQLSILNQSNHLALRLKVRELVGFGRFPYSKGRLNAEDTRIIADALSFAELDDLADAYLDELSGGQRQRAFVAMIIAQDTHYVLLDEPLNNLDMNYSVQVMKMLRRLADEKDKTIVIVTHEINFAAQYSDYIMVMKDGKIMHHDVVDRIIKPEILKNTFGIPFDILEQNGKKICNYYNL